MGSFFGPSIGFIYLQEDSPFEKARYKVIFIVNSAIFLIFTTMALWLLIKGRWRLHGSAIILICAFLFSFVCKVVSDSFRVFIKNDSEVIKNIDATFSRIISLSTEIADFLQVFVMYYFVMNVGMLI